MHKIIYVAFAGAMLFQSAFAQSDAGPDNGLPDRIVSYFDMTPEVLEGYAPDGNELGMATQLFSFVGREDLTQRLQDTAYTQPTCPVLREDGLQAVLEAVGDARIVMINEAHDDKWRTHVAQRNKQSKAKSKTSWNKRIRVQQSYICSAKTSR